MAANLTRILEREPLAEWVGSPVRPGPVETEVLELSARLAKLLRAGAAEPSLERRAFAALFAIAKAKLRVARPGYDAVPLDDESAP